MSCSLVKENLAVFQKWKSQFLTLLRKTRQLQKEFLKNLRLVLSQPSLLLKTRPRRRVVDQQVLRTKPHDGRKSSKNPLYKSCQNQNQLSLPKPSHSQKPSQRQSHSQKHRHPALNLNL